MRRRAVVAALVVLALAAVACGSDNKTTAAKSSPAKSSVTIGAFSFSESAILANIYAEALRARGIRVTVRPNLGNREIVEPALEKGEIDLYPGYAATDLEFINKGAGEATPDITTTIQKLRQRFSAKGVTVLQPSTAIDTNAFAVTKATAQKDNLKQMSDLAPFAKGLTLGGPPECPTRPYCQPGLEKTYGLKFKAFKPLDAGGPLSKAALERGDVDVALIFSSDGAIPAKGFVVLEDDKKLQNADNVVPVVRDKALDETVRSALDGVSMALTTDQLAELNKRADVDKEDPEALAKDWWAAHFKR